MVQLSSCKFCWYANEINLLKSSKNMIFWPIFDPKIGFFAILAGETQSYHFKTTFNRVYGQKYV